MIVYKFTRDTSNKYYIQTAVVLLNSKRAARVIGVSIQFDYFYNKSVSLQFKEKLYQFSTTFNLSLPKVYAVASSFSGGEIQKHNNRVYTKLSFILPPYALTNRQRNSCFIGRFHYYYYYVEFYSRARDYYAISFRYFANSTTLQACRCCSPVFSIFQRTGDRSEELHFNLLQRRRRRRPRGIKYTGRRINNYRWRS